MAQAEASVQNAELAALYRMHGDFVYKTLARFGVPEADRGDQLHEVFVVVQRRLKTFRGDAKITTWLYTIARRVAAGYRRKAHISREVVRSDPHAGQVAHDNPEVNTQRARARMQLETILNKLNLDQRAVFVMFEIDEMTGQEIADEIGCPLQTVFSRLRRAREAFERHVMRLQTSEERRAS